MVLGETVHVVSAGAPEHVRETAPEKLLEVVISTG
jgi:hypothetical protein